jgi:hypothetical protein
MPTNTIPRARPRDADAGLDVEHEGTADVDFVDAQDPLPGNAPRRVRGSRGVSGPRQPPPSPVESVERRKVLLHLLENRVSRDEQRTVMSARFAMKPGAVDRLRGILEAELLDSDRELLPLTRAKQVGRLHAHIQGARRDKSWNAVAALERTLAQVQGTLEPVQVQVSVEATVRDAVGAVLSGLSRPQLEALLTTGELVPELGPMPGRPTH